MPTRARAGAGAEEMAEEMRPHLGRMIDSSHNHHVDFCFSRADIFLIFSGIVWLMLPPGSRITCTTQDRFPQGTDLAQHLTAAGYNLDDLLVDDLSDLSDLSSWCV